MNVQPHSAVAAPQLGALFFPDEAAMESEDSSVEWLSIYVEDCLSSSTSYTNPGFAEQAPTMLTNQSAARSKLPIHSSSNSRREKRKLTSVINDDDDHDDDKIHYGFFAEPPLLLLDQKHWLAESELILPKKDEDQELVQQQERKQEEEKKCEMITGMQFQKEQPMRRCSRCFSNQTSQWRRDGSSGPKTLCNACGLRLKAGNGLSTISKKFLGQEIDKGHEQQKRQGKKKIKKATYVNEELPPEEPVKRCTHCMSYKTPQWRAGPLGPKTLCNACGVRFKSGRLLPEYRPANSPSFVNCMHSNSHKKVMQLRQTVAHTEK